MKTPNFSSENISSKEEAGKENPPSFSFDFSRLENRHQELRNEKGKDISLETLYPTSVDQCSVVKYNEEKGFGFLKGKSSKENIFFHVSNYYLPEEATKKEWLTKKKEAQDHLTEKNELITSLVTKCKEKGLASESWCFSNEAKEIVDKKIGELIDPIIKQELKRELLSQIDPEILGGGYFTCKIKHPYNLEEDIIIEPVIKKGPGDEFSLFYEKYFRYGQEEQQKEQDAEPIQLPGGLHVLEKTLHADSIDDLSKLEKEFCPIHADKFAFEKNTVLPEEVQRKPDFEKSFGVRIENAFNLLVQDDLSTIDTLELTQEIEKYKPGKGYGDFPSECSTEIVFKNQKLQGELRLSVLFSPFNLEDEHKSDSINEELLGKKIILPHLSKSNHFGAEGIKDIFTNADDLEKFYHLLKTERFLSEIQKETEKFMRENYSKIVTSQKEKLFTGGFSWSIKSFATPVEPPIRYTRQKSLITSDEAGRFIKRWTGYDESNFNEIMLIEKDIAENLWNHVDEEMRESAIVEIEKDNMSAVNMAVGSQENRQKDYFEAPSEIQEIIGDRYAKRIREIRRGYSSDITTYLDLKTGSVLYEEDHTSRTEKGGYRETLGGDGWRRGMVVSGTKEYVVTSTNYIINDKRFENAPKGVITNEEYEMRRKIIIKNIETIRQGNDPDQEFNAIIKETEERRDEEKKLFRKYLGESYKDPYADFGK